ncbi:MAG: DUF4405 domain-containing protein [Desulfatirhabdiaceae bacterium]
MKKNDLKLIINALMVVDFCAIFALGLLLKLVIPGGGQASKYFLGLHRHEWGNFHFYLGIFLIGLLMIHVWMNWTWVLHSVKTTFGDSWKKFLTILAGAWIMVLILGWMFAFIN